MALPGAVGSIGSLFVWAQTVGPELETRMRVAIPTLALTSGSEGGVAEEGR